MSSFGIVIQLVAQRSGNRPIFVLLSNVLCLQTQWFIRTVEWRKNCSKHEAADWKCSQSVINGFNLKSAAKYKYIAMAVITMGNKEQKNKIKAYATNSTIWTSIYMNCRGDKIEHQQNKCMNEVRIHHRVPVCVAKRNKKYLNQTSLDLCIQIPLAIHHFIAVHSPTSLSLACSNIIIKLHGTLIYSIVQTKQHPAWHPLFCSVLFAGYLCYSFLLKFQLKSSVSYLWASLRSDKIRKKHLNSTVCNSDSHNNDTISSSISSSALRFCFSDFYFHTYI